MDIKSLRCQCIISNILVNSLLDLKAIITDKFGSKYSQFEIRHVIKTLIRIVKQEDFEEEKNDDEYLSLHSQFMQMPTNKNLDLIENDKLNKMPSRLNENRMRYTNVDITYVDEDADLPEEIICEEQRLLQVMLCIVLKLLRTTIRAEIVIETAYDRANRALLVRIKENGNMFTKEQAKLQ
jgi:hypothetical protein